LIELALFGSLGYWGWHLGHGLASRWILCVSFAVCSAGVWFLFRTFDEPIPWLPAITIAGRLRLALEAVIVGLAAYGVWTSGSRAAAESLLTVVVLHTVVTWDRVSRLAAR
jgi:hypothetical protein